MKKNIINTILVIMICFFVWTKDVNASVVTGWDAIKIDGKTVKYLYDNEASTSGTAADKVKLGYPAGYFSLTIDGVKYTAYCIEFGIDIQFGTATSEGLYDYFSKAIGAEKAKDLITKISLYSKYGYGSSNDRKTANYFLATQQLIWEAISDTGFYATDYYAQRAVEGNMTNWEPTKISNFRWIIINSDGSYGDQVDVSTEIATIKKSVNSYYVTPSFCSVQEKVEFELGETITVNDNNNVLSQYDVLCDDGLVCDVKGNSLSITDTNDAGSNNITFIKTGTSSDAYIYRYNNSQGIVTNIGIIDDITCNFGVNSFQNVKTADVKIIYIITIAIVCGIASYLFYGSKKLLDSIK